MALEDSLPTRSTTARQVAYDNTLDRVRVELPPSGDAGVVGSAQINLDNWDGVLPTILADRDGDELNISQNGVVTMDQEYFKVVEGKLYSVSHVPPSVPSASSYVYLIDMDPRRTMALVSKIKALGEFHIDMYEGATVAGSGSLLYPQNFNRTSASGLATKFYSNAWVEPSGTKIFEGITSSVDGSLSTEASAAWILDADQGYYVLSVTNRTGSAGTVAIELTCTEEGV